MKQMKRGANYKRIKSNEVQITKESNQTRCKLQKNQIKRAVNYK